jgi:hypothetical protein
MTNYQHAVLSALAQYVNGMQAPVRIVLTDKNGKSGTVVLIEDCSCAEREAACHECESHA